MIIDYQNITFIPEIGKQYFKGIFTVDRVMVNGMGEVEVQLEFYMEEYTHYEIIELKFKENNNEEDFMWLLAHQIYRRGWIHSIRDIRSSLKDKLEKDNV